jgi:hypothetical protein
MKTSISRTSFYKSVCAIIAIPVIIPSVCFSNTIWDVRNTYHLGVTAQDVTYGYTLTITNEDFTSGDFSGTASHDGVTYPITGNTTANSISGMTLNC